MERLYDYCISGNAIGIDNFLIDNPDFDINSRFYSGITMLHAACKFGQLDILKTLLRYEKIDVNRFEPNNNLTPLHIACQKFNVEIVLELLRHKDIDPNLMDLRDESALSHAIWNGRKQIIEILINDPRIEIYPEDFYMIIFKWIDLGKNLLINKRITSKHVNYIGIYGKSIIFFMTRDIDLMKLFIKDVRTDINLQTYYGQTILHEVCMSENVDILKSLLNHPILNVNIRCKKGKTPFFMACSHNKIEMIKILLKDGRVDVNMPDHEKISPLYKVLSENYINISQILLKNIRILVDKKSACRYPDIIRNREKEMPKKNDILIYASADGNLKIENNLKNQNLRLDKYRSFFYQPKEDWSTKVKFSKK